MVRSIAAVVVGYVVMAVCVFVGLTALFFAVGPDKAFEPGNYDTSMMWSVLSLVWGLIAAIVGGLVCGMIAKGPGAVKVLAILVFALGILVAIPTISAAKNPPAPREPGPIANLEAMTGARSPVWVAFGNAIVGGVGATVGGRLRKKTA